MRIAALLMIASLGFSPQHEAQRAQPQRETRVAQLTSSVASLFLRLVNERIKGHIDPQDVTFVPPASVELKGVTLTGKDGKRIATVRRAQVQVSVSALLSGEIVISRIDVDDPVLSLRLDNGELNLLQALSPTKPPDPNAKDSDANFRIADVIVSGGDFRFTDDKNVTLAFDGIAARASIDVNLAVKAAIVDVKDVRVAKGTVDIKDTLMIPVRTVTADRVRIVTDKIDITNARAYALGTTSGKTARIGVSGKVDVKGDGMLKLTGSVESDAGAWPERLEALPFVTPSLRTDVAINGPFREPTIDIKGDLGNTSISGYTVDSGTASVRITPTTVTINDGTTLKLGKGTVRATGTVKLPSEGKDAVLDVRARAADVAFATAVGPASLDTPLRGIVAANVAIGGRAGKATELTIAGDVSTRGVQLYDLVLPPLGGDVRVTVSPTRVTLSKVALHDGDNRVNVSGDVDLKGEKLNLNFDAAVVSASAIVTQLPKDLAIGRAQGKGTITGPFKNVVVDVAASVPKGVAYGTAVADVRADVRVTPKEVRVDGVTGRYGDAAIAQTERLLLTIGKSTTTMASGRFKVTSLDLAKVKTPKGDTLPVTGNVSGVVAVRGTTKAPRVTATVRGTDIVIEQEQLGTVDGDAMITRDDITITKLRTQSPLGKVSSELVTLGLNDDTLRGVLTVADVDLSAISHAQSLELKGRVGGDVSLGGTLSVPSIFGRLKARRLSAAGMAFGRSDIVAGLGPDEDGGPKARAAFLSLVTNSQRRQAQWRVRASYALDRDAVNVEAFVRDLDLNTFSSQLGTKVVPLEGQVTAKVTLRGPLAKPSGSVLVEIPTLSAQVPARGDDGVLTTRTDTLGGVMLAGAVSDGVIAARLCAFVDERAQHSDDSPCDGPRRVWATIGGSADLLRGTTHLLVEASVMEDAVHELVPALHERDIKASVTAKVDVALDVPEQGAMTWALAGSLQRLGVSVPGAPALKLTAPVDIDYVDGRGVLGDTPARFATNSEGLDLVIAAGSSVGSDDIDLAIDGQLALAALKLVTDEIANAAGVAETHLKATGRFDEGVLVAGIIEPQAGARITPRSLGQPVVFDAARITVRPHDNDSTKLLVTFDSPCQRRMTETCPLRAQVGNGRVQLKGDVTARTSRADDEPWIEQFDLAASATGVDVKTSLGRVEAALDIALRGSAPNPVLSGRVDISDGLLRKDFLVQNFILTQAPSRPSAPLWQTLEPFGLGDLEFDLEASLQNVRTRARISTFSIDTSVRGDLRISRSLRFPGVGGAIEVESGTVDFPRARFDVLELQLQFPTSPDGSLKPVLHLSARAELPPGAAGNQVEIPVDLTLDGTFEQMQLDMTATDPARQWTRSELFANVLFGVVPSTNETGVNLVGTSIDVAGRAALRELAAPVNREVEALLASGLGVHVNIDVVSGFQLQLGRRLVLEGPGLLSQALGNSDSTTSTTAATSGTDALRVRLLLWDHLQFGRALSAEGRFGLVSDLRLSLRLVEQ